MVTHSFVSGHLAHPGPLGCCEPGTQESDPVPTVTSPGLRSGSGLAGHIVVLHADFSERLTSVAIS